MTFRFNKQRELLVIEGKDLNTNCRLEKFVQKLYEGQADLIEQNIDYLMTKISINEKLEILGDYFNILPFREMKEFKEKMRRDEILDLRNSPEKEKAIKDSGERNCIHNIHSKGRMQVRNIKNSRSR